MLQINFLPWRQQKAQFRRKKCLLLFSLLASGLLIVLQLNTQQQYASINHYQRQLSLLESEHQQQLNHLEMLNKHHADYAKLLERYQEKQNQIEQNRQSLSLFKQLPQLLPTNSWLDKLSHQNGYIEFNANSRSFNEIILLISQLQQIDILKDIQLGRLSHTSSAINQLQFKATWREAKNEDIQ